MDGSSARNGWRGDRIRARASTRERMRALARRATPTRTRATRERCARPRTRTTARATREDETRDARRTSRPGRAVSTRDGARARSSGDAGKAEKAPEPWWPVDARTGKPPGWFQLVVFAASQVFIGLVMQPAALVYQSLFDPFLKK